MEITENMFYGMGQIALAIAKADGQLDKEEVKAMQRRIEDIGNDNGYDLSMIESAFLQHMKTESFTSAELLKEGIHNFHLGDSHLTPKLADLFLIILMDLAESKGTIVAEEKAVLDEFLRYLTDRKAQAAYREKGYVKNVLIPVDFTDLSNNVVAKVKDLEHWLHTGFKVTLLHCIAPEDLHNTSFVEERVNATNKMNELVSSHLEDKSLHEMVEYDVLNERLHYLDQKYLDDKEIDIVIMATHGKDKDDFTATTHTSEHIQRHYANYIVLPDNVEIRPIKKIAICTDYNFATYQQFAILKELAQANDAAVTFVHVDDEDPSEEQLKKREELMKYMGSRDVEEITPNNAIHEDIIEFAHTQLYDLLVVLPRHTAFFEKFDGHHSVVKDIVQYTKTPLMVLNGQKQATETESMVQDKL